MRTMKRLEVEMSALADAGLPADWADHVAELVYEESVREGGALPWVEPGLGEPAPYVRPVVP